MPNDIPASAPDIASDNEPAASVTERLGKLLTEIQEGTVTPESWHTISQTLEASKEAVVKLTEVQLHTLMSQMDALQQKVLDTPQAKEVMEMLQAVQARIAGVRSETYARMKSLFSTTGESSLGKVMDQANALTGGSLKNMIPGMPALEGLGTFFKADGFGGAVLRTAQRFLYGALNNAGSTKIFGMELKSLFGNVFSGNAEALRALDMEDALRSTIKKLNGERKNGRPPFALPDTWNDDVEALASLEEKRGSVPLPDFLSAQLKQFSRVFDGGPVTLRRLADALERKPTASKKEPSVTKVETEVPATDK